MAPKSAVKLAHELLTKARDDGSEDAAWEDIFTALRKQPAALVRPDVRKLSLLHQAAYWGHKVAVETLVNEFGADPKDLTADGEDMDAAAVAESQGHHGVATALRCIVAKAKKNKKTKTELQDVKAAKKPEAALAEAVQLAHELLSRARDDGAEDAAWEEILAQLRKVPAAIARPEKRKFSLLHQAAYWGKEDVARTLVKEFVADVNETTADEEKLVAADVAASQGHDAVATVLRKLATAKAASAPTDAAEAEEEEEGEEDADVDAPSPYDAAKAESNAEVDAALPGSVSVWLCFRADGENSRWEPYTAAQNAAIEAARAAGASQAKVDKKTTLEFKPSVEVASGKKSRVSCFHVLWEWDKGEGGKAAPEWEPYPPQGQWALEAAMCAKDAVAHVQIAKGKQYVVDLVGLRQHSSKDAFRCRRVRRRGVPLREAFPPKVRDVSTGSWLDLTCQPDYWSAGGNAPKRYDLPADSPVVALISEWLNNTVRTGHAAAYGQLPGGGGPTKGMEVVRVEVVQQPALWRRYCCYKEMMKLQSKEIKDHAGTKYLQKHPMALPVCDWLDKDVNEAYFWHGSGKSPDGSVDLVDAITSTGHAPSDENGEVMEVTDGASSRFAKNTSMFGSGVYLADVSTKANLYVPCPTCYQGSYFRGSCSCSKATVENGEPYRMLLCRAVLGRVYVERSYSDKRYKGEFNPAKKLGADSVMGEAKPGQLAFREYIVYSDSASYPEFVVHYWRRSGPVKPAEPPKKKAKKG